MSGPRRRGWAAALAALLALGAAGEAAAADGPAKRAAPQPSGRMAHATEAGDGAGAGRLLVTFAGTPSRAVVERRLGDLGRLTPALAEAGIWGLAPRDPGTAAARAARRPGVAGVEWAGERTPTERPRPPAPPPPAPVAPITDPLFTPAAQWHLFAPRPLWSASLTGYAPRPRIAIIDGGISRTHEEWGGPASPVVAARSTLHRSDDASDRGTSGHGTHVAGIAAAPANGVGIVGVAPARAGSAEIVPVQVSGVNGRAPDEAIIRGIRHAVMNGARVINISLGGDDQSLAFQDAILWATERGALVVASAGNEGFQRSEVQFPAGYDHVLGVGAQCDANPTTDCPSPFGAAAFSSRNESVDVIAPGVNILSSIPMRVTERRVQLGYGLKDGASMAAPYVAGVAALVMAANGGRLSSHQTLRQIQLTATDLPPAGRDDASGHGVVDPSSAVTLAAPADDAEEINDDVKWLTGQRRLRDDAAPRPIEARADELDDPDDVYAVRLARGQRLRAVLTHGRGRLDLYLWRPGTATVDTEQEDYRSDLLRFRGGSGRRKVLTYRAARSGVHYLNVYARTGASDYTLRLSGAG
jgi:subtilisin family serine protease